MYLAAERAGTGTLRRGFHPKLNGRVYALAVSPNHRFLYVGGQFSSVGGHPRHNLAAFNLRTGRLSARIPDLSIPGTVRAMAVSRRAASTSAAASAASPGCAVRIWPSS